MNVTQARKALHRYARADAAKFAQRFFRTGPGEYGEGDKFIGATVPQVRKVAKEFDVLPYHGIEDLLRSKIHEERLLALILLVSRYRRAVKLDDPDLKKRIFKTYVSHLQYINNWDLVDVSAEHIVGAYLRDRDKKLLCRLARSKKLFERRVAMLSTFHYIRNHEFKDAVAIARILLHDKHDLIHKAVGWLLREAGKREKSVLISFLDRHAGEMPRTMLRYALERLSLAERKYYMSLPSNYLERRLKLPQKKIGGRP